MEYLFVYGTLRTTEGHPMHNFMRGYCYFVGDASIGGINVELSVDKAVNIGTVSGEDADENKVIYPGLIPSGNPGDRVEGELFRIHPGASEALFQGLDHYEGCGEDDPEPHDFFRHRQEVILLADNTAYEAWVYLYNGDID